MPYTDCDKAGLGRDSRELPTEPGDANHLGDITNSIDKGGRPGLQAAVTQAIYEKRSNPS